VLPDETRDVACLYKKGSRSVGRSAVPQTASRASGRSVGRSYKQPAGRCDRLRGGWEAIRSRCRKTACLLILDPSAAWHLCPPAELLGEVSGTGQDGRVKRQSVAIVRSRGPPYRAPRVEPARLTGLETQIQRQAVCPA